jgi:hypothetical protein
MLVEIRPIESKKWHGKSKAENFTRPKKLSALVDPEKMTYATGLNADDIAYLVKQGITYDLSNNFSPDKPHPFWDSKVAILELENSTKILNTDNPLKFIHSKIAKASKYVANSMLEFEEGLFPDATHVIFNEEEEADVKASKVLLKNKAVELSGKLSKDRKIQLIMIMDGKNLKGQSDNFLVVAMNEIIQRDPEELVRHIEMDKEQTALYALVLECLQKNALTKKGHKIYYADSVIGQDEYAVAEYLAEDENQELKIRLMKTIN